MVFTIENVACLGACGMAPVMMINDRTYGKLTADSAVKAVEDFRGGGNGGPPADAVEAAAAEDAVEGEGVTAG
jgi:(2Fe-2S) ferredoxin